MVSDMETVVSRLKDVISVVGQPDDAAVLGSHMLTLFVSDEVFELWKQGVDREVVEAHLNTVVSDELKSLGLA
jgi:hypothetical protein